MKFSETETAGSSTESERIGAVDRSASVVGPQGDVAGSSLIQEANDLSPREVTDFFNALDKAVRARRLYAPCRPAAMSTCRS